MQSGSEDRKRVISLGFGRLEELELEGDTIYVDFRYDSGTLMDRIISTAYSGEEFLDPIYQDVESSTNVLTATSNRSDGEFESHMGYEDFLQNLVEYNNGEIDYSRLISDGSDLLDRLSQIQELVSVNSTRPVSKTKSAIGE